MKCPASDPFVEIEAGNLGDPSKTIEDLRIQCDHYMKAFEVGESDLIHHSYSDMLLANK
jgi:adenylate cyclase class IV